MAGFHQHERHIGRRKAFEIQHRKHAHIIRAVGETAISTAYHVMDEEQARRAERAMIRELTGHAPRSWRVEVLTLLHSDFGGPKQDWVTAEPAMQGRTLEGAVNLVRNQQDRYRLMVRCGKGWAQLRNIKRSD